MGSQWIRLVLAISLDGRLALPWGGKTQLGSNDDRKVLEESLAWSDATLIGGGTLRAHQNTCLIHDSELIKHRISEGRSEQPIALVISNQKDFCQDWPFFNQPIKRWLISSKASSTQQNIVGRYERLFTLDSDWTKTFTQLKEEGLKRIVLLGGAKLIGSLLKADLVDELQLTLTSKIIGGEYTWVPTHIAKLPKILSSPNAWLLEDNYPLNNNELLLRYFRNRPSNKMPKKNQI